MEARLLEYISSLRQLISTNVQLEEALRDGHQDDGKYDDDLLQALEENDELIVRRRNEANLLSMKLSAHGVKISLVDKLPRYDGSTLLKQMREEKRKNEKKKDGEGGGMYL